MDMQPIFRRLADRDADRFRPWHTWPALKIGWVFLLAIVGIKWITK